MKRSLKAVLLSMGILAAAGLSLLSNPLEAAAPGDRRVKSALDELGWAYQVDKDGDFYITMKFDDGRSQRAWIMSDTNELGEMEIRHVFSPGYLNEGDAMLPQEVANRLLEDSMQQKLGAWQVMSSQQSRLAVYVMKLDANSSAQELKMALGATLTTADEMEKELTGGDRF